MAPALLQLMGAFPAAVAYVVNRRLEVLAANTLADALLSPLADRRQVLRSLFLDPAARALYTDWRGVAQCAVEALRLAAGHHPDDPRMAATVAELRSVSEEFEQMWRSQGVRSLGLRPKTFDHPAVGTPCTPATPATAPSVALTTPSTNSTNGPARTAWNARPATAGAAPTSAGPSAWTCPPPEPCAAPRSTARPRTIPGGSCASSTPNAGRSRPEAPEKPPAALPRFRTAGQFQTGIETASPPHVRSSLMQWIQER
ncbi:MmyB family transcriptional regulator [Kitasatospora purpeofusca]|uniref:MmyB family transcriptional regulator n=1 Tax=Kitasatospora purpeofusca TaxID=67352 RepID=UPI001FC98F9B|nr:hypothetical protein [Kitasatospora purpeofusca]